VHLILTVASNSIQDGRPGVIRWSIRCAAFFWICCASTACFAASPNGTTIPPATQIVDSNGAIWTADATGARLCYRNGVQPSGCANVNVLLYYNNVIYVGNTYGTWYQWNGSSWTVIPGDPRGSTSSNNTMLYDQAYTLTDASGNVWSLYYGTCFKNGSPSSRCVNVRWMLYYNSTVYFTDSSGSWFSWNGSAWVSVASDPRATTLRYVSSAVGSDTYDGTTPTVTGRHGPWATISYAAGRVSAGTTVFILTGTYVGAPSFAGSGTAANPIIFQQYPGNTVTIALAGGTIGISGNYLIVGGLQIHDGTSAVYMSNNNAGVYISGSNDFFLNSTVDFISGTGMMIQRANHDIAMWLIVHDTVLNHCNSNCTSYNGNNWGSATQIYGPQAPSPNATGDEILYSRIYNNWGEGIYAFYGATNTVFAYNTVYNNWYINITLGNSLNGSLHDNVVWWDSASPRNIVAGLWVNNDDPANNSQSSTGNVVYNNMAIGCNMAIGDASGALSISNTVFAFNTVLTGAAGGGGFVVFNTNTGTITGVTLENNIFTAGVSYWNSTRPPSSVTANHNLWPSAQPAPFAGTGGVIGNPMANIAQTPGSPSADTLTPPWFSLTTGSIAGGKGIAIPGFTIDALGKTHPVPPAIGAIGL
jgi:hypothetical protein